MDVRAADLDKDGDLDIILANEFQANTILWNDGEGVFTKAATEQLPQEVHDSEDIAVADFNGDGHLDILFCSEDDITLGWTNVHEFYLGSENGNFTSSPYSFPDSEANAVLAMDVNADGWMDVVFGNKGFNRIYINQGDGTFAIDAARLPEISRTTQDLATADIDGDGDLDLMEGNEDVNVLLLNNGSGTFSDISSTHLPSGINMETRKVTFGDVDLDNDQDVFLSNVHFIQGKDAQNRLYINDGSGKFTDGTSERLPVDTDHTIDAVFEDVDLDSDPDIIVANVFGAPIKIYRNNGSGIFEVATADVLGNNYVRDALGVITADLNEDGLKDIYICDRFMPQANRKDLLLLREPDTGVSETKDPLQITVHPNPIAGNFFVTTSIAGLRSVMLENLQGQIIDTISLEWQDEETYIGSVDHLNLASGMYIMHFPKQKKKVMVMIKH